MHIDISTCSVTLSPKFYVLLTVHLDIIVLRKPNLLHNLLLVYFVILYTFRAHLGPSSGGTTVCIQQFVLILLNDYLLSWLDWNWFQSNHLNRQSSKIIISTNFCIHTVVPPDDGSRYARNHVEVDEIY